MESFFSPLKTERPARKMYRTRDDAKADVFDYIERFYNPKRRDDRIFEPYGVRAAGWNSLSGCLRNRVQLRLEQPLVVLSTTSSARGQRSRSVQLGGMLLTRSTGRF